MFNNLHLLFSCCIIQVKSEIRLTRNQTFGDVIFPMQVLGNKKNLVNGQKFDFKGLPLPLV